MRWLLSVDIQYSPTNSSEPTILSAAQIILTVLSALVLLCCFCFLNKHLPGTEKKGVTSFGQKDDKSYEEGDSDEVIARSGTTNSRSTPPFTRVNFTEMIDLCFRISAC